MVETAFNRMKKNPAWFKNVGIVIVDEAHLDNFSKTFPFFDDVIVIGFTASPISSNKRKPMKDFYQDIVVCTQIPDLIEQRALVPNVTFNAESVHREELKSANNADGFDVEAMAATYSVGKHIENTVKAYEQFSVGKKTLVFNCNKDHSKLVNEAFLAAGYNSRHLDSDAPEYERTKTLEWFRATPDAVLNNIGILTTGFDEPSIQSIIINKATASVALWLQMCGRGGRPFPGKDLFTIVDMGGNCRIHGDWNEWRDWEKIFHHPELPPEGGIGGVKECPHCHALISVSSRICKWCQTELIVTTEQLYDQANLEFKLFTKKLPPHINVAQIIEDNKHAKAFYSLHQIKHQLIRHYKIETMTDQIAYEMLALYQDKVEEWCRLSSKDYNQFMKEKSAQWLQDELKTIYSWTPPAFLISF
jgi:superfamily II DNA or RNA helicase